MRLTAKLLTQMFDFIDKKSIETNGINAIIYFYNKFLYIYYKCAAHTHTHKLILPEGINE